jgi:hypothetical protein
MTNAEIDALPLTERAKKLMRWIRDNGMDWRTIKRWDMLRCPNVGRKTAQEIILYREVATPPPPPPSERENLIRDAIIILERLLEEVKKDQT